MGKPILPLRYKRYADRIQELIKEGQEIARSDTSTTPGFSDMLEDKVSLHAWAVKVSNILESVFGPSSPQVRHCKDYLDRKLGSVGNVNRVVGVLTGALNDLENGYLLGQEFIIAGEVFDSVLDQSKQFNQEGYKDPAAVLARIVLEDALKRITRSEGLDDNRKAAVLNNELKKIGRYPQLQWRQIQYWLDIGNDAAHGDFGNYDEEKVKGFIEGLERFLAAEFRL